ARSRSIHIPPASASPALSRLYTSPLLAAFFFSHDTATTEIYTLSLHDALHDLAAQEAHRLQRVAVDGEAQPRGQGHRPQHAHGVDRKSTRLNSSHVEISYAVFCLKKKKKS